MAPHSSGGGAADADAMQPLLAATDHHSGPLVVQVEEAQGLPAHQERACEQPASPVGSLLGAAVQPGNTHWLLTTAVMLSDMLGLGTLSLPAGGCQARRSAAGCWSPCASMQQHATTTCLLFL
jgi:hypothetical protein